MSIITKTDFMKWPRRLAMWIVLNVPCGKLAPVLLGFAIKSKSIRREL